MGEEDMGTFGMFGVPVYSVNREVPLEKNVLLQNPNVHALKMVSSCKVCKTLQFRKYPMTALDIDNNLYYRLICDGLVARSIISPGPLYLFVLIKRWRNYGPGDYTVKHVTPFNRDNYFNLDIPSSFILFKYKECQLSLL